MNVDKPKEVTGKKNTKRNVWSTARRMSISTKAPVHATRDKCEYSRGKSGKNVFHSFNYLIVEIIFRMKFEWTREAML